MAFTNNYTLGRGKVYFARRDPTTGILGAYRYLGNTPEVNLTAEEEKLEHYSSDFGVRVKDATVTLQVNYTGTVVCDNIDAENVALFFLGESANLTVAQATVTSEVVTTDAEVGMFYQLGVTSSNRAGSRGIIFPGASGTAFALKIQGEVGNLVHGTDYVLNPATGRIEILETGAVDNGDTLECTYTVAASTRERIISGATAIEGALFYEAANPRGDQRDATMPSVTLSPNGDFSLKSDEWQQIPFNLDVTKLDDDTNAIIWDSRPVIA